MGAANGLTQKSFRNRNDDGSESSATWEHALNTNWTQDTDELFRVRFLIERAAVAQDLNTPHDLEYRIDGGSWTSVTASSTHVQVVNSDNLTDHGDTTQQLGSGTYAEYPGNEQVVDASSATGYCQWNKETLEEMETEWSLKIIGSLA